VLVNSGYPGEPREDASRAGVDRNEFADDRDGIADDGEPGDERDRIADRRDRAARQRDKAGEQRDKAGNQRDVAAVEREHTAKQSEERAGAPIPEDALIRSALARQDAASDRSHASLDRNAGASDRNEAEVDRSIAEADRGASAQERESASLDSLTGAYLRGAGLVELKREIARAKRSRLPLTLAFVDVDSLKAVNDSGGHAAGDRLLVRVANTLAAALRESDLIIRYGGDEFVCVIPGLDIAEAVKRLGLVNATLAKTPESGSVTAGLAELREDDSPADLVGRADAALYQERQRRTSPHPG
jgi:diguanylate cyclase (GGDEF)-like protein